MASGIVTRLLMSMYQLTPEGLSLRPIMQFMAEVEELLLAHELI
jgi:DNA-binding HxlR family transcriptional regulator